MLRKGIVRLQSLTLPEIARLWLGGQPRCTLWHSSSVWSSNKKTDTGDGSSSSSSDSDSDSEKGTGVDKKLQDAAEGVAQSIPGHGAKVQSDLLQQLQSFAKLSQDQAAGETTSSTAAKASSLLGGMQVQKKLKTAGGDRSSTPMRGGRPSGEGAPFRRMQPNADREKVKLFDGPALGIFTAAADSQGSVTPVAATDSTPMKGTSLWKKVEEEQLAMFIQLPPTNAFEEMIQWTKEGKLWRFPINNEQGLDEEAEVGFHQHVFLEGQIADFPRRGPIRYFMELVLIGLSKNPHLSVQQKHEHIQWFRQYFTEKQDILQAALGKDGLIDSPNAS